MRGKNKVIPVLVAFFSGVVASMVFFSAAPETERSEQRQLRAELEARVAAESARQQEIARLEAVLEETKGELARKTRLVEDLQAQMERFTEKMAFREPEKETVLAQKVPMDKVPEQLTRVPEELTEKLQQPSREEMQTVNRSDAVPAPGNRPVVGRSAIALGVKDREPVKVSERVSIAEQRVYCWLHVIDGEGEEITVRWISKGKRIGETHLPVGSNSWRTWSYITLSPNMVGPAWAEILDRHSELLKTLSFEITEVPVSTDTG